MAIYLLDNDFICTGPVLLPVIPGIGAQLPGNAVELGEVLPLVPGHVWAWRDGAPQQLRDLRGPVYSKDSGEVQEWTELGELPGELTVEACPGPFYVWSNDGWELDELAEKEAETRRALATRDGLIFEAGLRIAPLQDAVDLGKATSAEEEALLLWKSYRVDLNRVEGQEDFPAVICWPVAPSASYGDAIARR
jgi:hypothetical protein